MARRRYRQRRLTHHIDHIVDGKIKERWTIGDLLGMMQQLGVIPTPG